LERAALKKDRYLNGKAPAPPPAAEAQRRPSGLAFCRQAEAGAPARGSRNGKLMPKATRDVPPPLELACLKALWSLQEGSVKDVQRIVAQSRPLAYTTIMTVLED